MSQYNVYRLPGGPLVLDVQSDLIDIRTRVVAPLIPLSDDLPNYSRLEPTFDIEGTVYALHIAELAAVPAAALGGVPVANLSAEHDAITRALDMVFHGF